MKSSTGQHYAGLDHIRALAALLVVVWHFTHGFKGYPVPFNTAPALGLFDEGHAGVAVFMTLSGYLFAKLLDGRQIIYSAFLWNRFIRLAPLLTLVIIAAGVVSALKPGFDPTTYLTRIAQGVALPTLPNGGWSITAELHFYLVLPVLLLLSKRWPYAPLILLACTIGTRAALHAAGYDMSFWSYWTIIGRIDQFMLGIFAFQHRRLITGPVASFALVAILGAYACFDAMGGFYGFPEPAVWVVIPAIEGACFATLIAWYDQHPLRGRWTYPMEKAGEYSYSIYLLHFFAVFWLPDLIHRHIMDISNFYVALPWALAFFAAMAVIGHFSFKFESWFLRYRVRYIRDHEAASQATARPLTI